MIISNHQEWHIFLEASGVAGSGKSVFGSIATLINGKYNTGTITLKGFEDPKLLSNLIGKTLAYSPDQEPFFGSADTLKRIAGGDETQTKILYKDSFDHRFNAVFIMTTNHPIAFSDKNGGVARRRVIIHFSKQVPKEKRDPYFLDKINNEVYGIINLILDRFKSNPNEAKYILDQAADSNESISIKTESNHLIDFAQAFKISDHEHKKRGLIWGSAATKKPTSETLYGSYLFYCTCNNIKPMNLRKFKSEFPDALRESGEKNRLKENTNDGYQTTNIHWKDYHSTIRNWVG